MSSTGGKDSSRFFLRSYVAECFVKDLLTFKSKKNATFNTNLRHFNQLKNIDNPALINIFIHLPISDPRTG